MHNLARQLIATGFVFACAFTIAGSSSSRLFGTAEASSIEGHGEGAGVGAGSGPCEGPGCTPLAVADAMCDPKSAGAIAGNVEACRIAGATPFVPEPEDLDYEPAWMSGMRKLDFPFKGYPRIERYIHYWTASPEGRRI